MKKFIFIILFLCLPIFVFADDYKDMEFAGIWYPADLKELTAFLNDLDGKTLLPDISGDILGIIAPHAGYIYSASLAVYGYKSAAQNKYDTIIILSPSHKYFFQGVTLYSGKGFHTPLGGLEVDENAVKEFKELEFARFAVDYFQGEHSQEAQMPFIKKYLPGTKIVPIIFGDMKYEQFAQIAGVLVKLSRQKKILIIVSSDLSHYHPYDDAAAIDSNTIDLIKSCAAQILWDTRGYAGGRACGIYPIITLLEYARKKNADIRILKYANSGDTAGDKNKVVGYVSAVITAKPKIRNPNIEEIGNKSETQNIKLEQTENIQEEKSMQEFILTDAEKKSLLQIARDSLESFVRYGKQISPVAKTETVKQLRGAFVTLTENGQLRGCIGRIIGDTPLYEIVAEYAVHAAVNDTRFTPVQENELKNIRVEISVLTPFEQVRNLDEIELGKHGVMLTLGRNSGLFLPQVAVEQGWDKPVFFKELCRKAGLPPDAYKDSAARLQKFSAIVFNEDEFK